MILANYLREINGYAPCSDFAAMFAMLPNNDRDPLRGVPAYAYGNEPRIPLLWFDHADSSRIPRQTPTLLMLRGALDTIVSNYFQERFRLCRYHGSADEFALAHSAGLSGWVTYMNGWAQSLPQRRRCRVVTYEQMHADTGSTCTDVIRFLAMEPNPEALERAIDQAQLLKMQTLERRGGFPGLANPDRDSAAVAALRAREGRVGSHVRHLSDATVQQLQRYARRRLNEPAKSMLVAHQLGTDLAID